MADYGNSGLLPPWLFNERFGQPGDFPPMQTAPQGFNGGYMDYRWGPENDGGKAFNQFDISQRYNGMQGIDPRAMGESVLMANDPNMPPSQFAPQQPMGPLPPPPAYPGANQFAGQSPAMGYAPEQPKQQQPLANFPASQQPSGWDRAGQAINDNALTLMALGGGIAAGGGWGEGIGRGLSMAVPAAAADRKQRTDLSSRAGIYQAVIGAGGTPAQAAAAAANPEVFKALAPDLFGAPKVVQTGEEQDIYGNNRKIFSLQKGHTLTPIGGGGQGGQGGPGGSSAGGLIDQSLTGDEFLNQKAIPADVAAGVRAYIKGDVMPTNSRRGYRELVQRIAAKYGEDIGQPIDENKYQEMRRLKTQLSSGNAASLGGQINIGRTSIGHLADLSDAAVKLDNIGTGLFGDLWGSAPMARLFNSVKNTAGEKSPQVNAFNDIRQRYVEEVTRFYAGGPGAQAERERAMKAFDAAKTPPELAEVIRAEASLMHSKISAIDDQVKVGLGEKEASKYKAVNEKTQSALDKIDANVSKLTGTAPQTPAKAAVPNAPPKVGDVRKGYVFIGGDPSKPESWKKQ